MLFGLFLKTLPEHLPQGFKVVLLCPFRHIFEQPLKLSLGQPLLQLLRDLVHRLYSPEVLRKSHIELVIFSFGFDQDVAAEIVEFHEGILSHALVQGFNKHQPFVK